MYLVSSYNGENGMYISHENGADKVDIWERWGLIPKDGRLSVTTPEPRYDFIDIPGATSALDISTVTSQYPTYQNRNGSWSFRFIRHPNLGNKTWHQIRSELLNFIHGRLCEIELKEDIDFISTRYTTENSENEPQNLYYRYRGRLSLTSWDSNEHETEVIISYNLLPYKLWALSSQDIKADTFIHQRVNGIGEAVVWDKNSFDLTFDEGETFYTLLDEMPIFPIIYYDVTVDPAAGETIEQAKKRAVTELSDVTLIFYNSMLNLRYERKIYLGMNELPECVITNYNELDMTPDKVNGISFQFHYETVHSDKVALYNPMVSLIFTPGRL